MSLDRVSTAWFTPLASNGRVDLEVPGRTLGDFDLCSVELGYDKSIEAFIVGLAVVGHQADRCRFADPKPASAVGAEVHACRVDGRPLVRNPCIEVVRKL